MFPLWHNLKAYTLYHNERAYIPCTNANDQRRQLAMTTDFPFFNRSIFTLCLSLLLCFTPKNRPKEFNHCINSLFFHFAELKKFLLFVYTWGGQQLLLVFLCFLLFFHIMCWSSRHGWLTSHASLLTHAACWFFHHEETKQKRRPGKGRQLDIRTGKFLFQGHC
jgi:hypothetical protein